MSQKRHRVVEMGGLIIVLILPLCFNPFATLPIEPAKVAFFQDMTIGLVIATTFSFFLNNRSSSFSERLRNWAELLVRRASNPLILPVLIYAAVYIVATATSIDPQLSLWGSSDGHGTVTVLSGAAFFLLVSDALRTREQVERMITVVLLGSVPVTIYGFVQYLGLDPLNWITDSVSPVLSTMGRSIFLGAYLAMVIPFTLSRIVSGRGDEWSLRYTLVLILQIACLLLTSARGAWLGFLGGCLTFLWLLARRWRSWTLLAISAIVLLVGTWFFVSMNNTAQSQLIDDVLSQSGPSHTELRMESVKQRITLWRNTLDLIPARWLLGYGPETLMMALSSRYVPGILEQRINVVTDDPHNLILDKMVATGIAGLLAFSWIIIRFYKITASTFRRGKDRRTEAALAAILSSSTAFLIQAQFNPNVIVVVVLFWLVLALGVVVHRWEELAWRDVESRHHFTLAASDTLKINEVNCRGSIKGG